MPWVEAERYGPVVWSGHLSGLISFAIPNVFITGVILYSLAIIFRNNIVSFVGAIAILVLYGISSGFVDDIQTEWLANVLDPFGFRPQGLLSKYMTVDEKNTRATPLQGGFLWNRVLWLAISVVLLVVLYFRFSFSIRNTKAKQQKETPEKPYSVTTLRSFKPDAANRVTPGLLAYLVAFEVKSIIRNPTFIVILILGITNLVTSLTSFTGNYGADQYPVTYDVVDTIRGAFYIFLIAIITFYTGVVVWKERDARINEIQDATPVKTAALFASKLIAIVIAVAVVMATTIIIGMGAQLSMGYTRLQPEVYFMSLMVSDLLSFSYLVVAALFFHYVINNRYIAYFAFIAFVVFNTFGWQALEVASNMIPYGTTPRIIYSDMNGYGPFVAPTVWFNVYWSLFALLLCFVIHAFYVRGRETIFRSRLSYAGRSLKRNAVTIGIAALAFIVCTGFVYYNTKVLNTVESSEDYEKKAVDYEKKYKKYEGLAQPRWYKLDYKIDIFPEERRMKVDVTGMVRNISSQAISEVYLTMPDLEDSIQVRIPGATLTNNDARLHFRIMKLAKPMLPGDSLPVNVSFVAENKGFENEVSFTSLTQNGTFFNNMDIMPVFGYSDNREMSDKNDRKKYKLPVRKKMPYLNEADSVSRKNSYISSDADWVTVNTVISTSGDQTAVAPGSLLKTWEDGGRKYFSYSLDHPSLNFYSFISARYEIARKKWNGIDIEVYYHKDHGYNVPNMLNSVEKSLKYYTEHFGPYHHKQARIIEFPRYSSFAQAFPGTMPYSEGIGFITDLRDVKGDDIDFVFYVVAHEMGHQYWAHQLCGAGMQGSEMMSEGFAQYAALMVMEKEYGRDKMKKFLKYEMDGYLRGRSRELQAERPLLRTEGQGYIHYQKASVVLYYLKEMIGEEKVNTALRSLLDSFAYARPPYPTAMSALRAFRAVTPDSLQYVVTDLFEHITLFSNRVVAVDYKQEGKGYKVTVKTSSEKFRSDSLGRETKVPVNDFMDIAVFAKAGDGKGLGKMLQHRRVKITGRDSSFTFLVNEKPYQAGIDPFNCLIDRLPDDNLKRLN
ncbi:MAG: hypothetical protein EOP49_09630 [Sphingobacteriales bacterium]|nr:MAG: hypothetical protein EOP49_09630 [Sphingobacteriales bacterium]